MLMGSSCYILTNVTIWRKPGSWPLPSRNSRSLANLIIYPTFSTAPLESSMATWCCRAPTSTLTRNSTVGVAVTCPSSCRRSMRHHPSVSSTVRATSSSQKMAPSRSTPRIMPVTEAAFQAECACSHRPRTPRATPPSGVTYTQSARRCHLQIPMVDPFYRTYTNSHKNL